MPKTIEINSLWTLIQRNPWPSATPVTVKVTDVKAGWVRFRIGFGTLSDDKLPIAEFLELYQPAGQRLARGN